ncbi:hypothetical protein BUALT_Bualt19G0079500 [Buddleja alternifolia]|uniref:Uncharacterized protein n=1 Tax=Buddleja alternifolia TaxID=168488 RepID=A0AAV6W629_9LAMI|nr:hypothetical protein BUALT_Bualt19G0078400 [Buddleja alternifolia]KAG8363987.1 hypothetical protein BUALT_Bualt19G0079500 [Buddleja alternifolia]
MRKGSRKMWWVVGCRSKKSLRTDSRMDIEEILKMKLETINEEPEINEENGVLVKHMSITKKVKKIHMKVKIGKLFTTSSQFSLKESYVIFMTGFASKGGLSGLSRY